MKIVADDPTCPICHRSDLVAGYKVCDDRGVWSHRCNRKEHGVYSLDEGKTFHDWPFPLYFDEEGYIETPHGDMYLVRQEGELA